MSDATELTVLSTVRGDLQEDGAVEEVVQDLIRDLNNFAEQWNSNVYPLVSTLPNGSVKKRRADRTQNIDPVANGFDGSQVFVDQTSRPEEFSGLLHTGTRPKTIKEVLLEVYQGTLSRQDAIERLLEDVAAAAEAYDDTQLRAWLIKLAAETWDPDEIALGATLNTANFGGAPVKGSTYSLNTRDKNLRNIIGIEGESLGLTEIDSLLVGANYISADTDIIAALLTLDSTISGMGGPITLQDAYDNSGAGTRRIEELATDPIEIVANAGNENALVLRGGIQLIDTIDATPEQDVFWIGPEHSGDADTGQFDLKIFAPDNALADDEIVRFSVNKGNLVAASDELVELFLGKVTANANLQRGALYLGRQTVGAGGLPHVTLDSYSDGGTETARLSTPLTMFEMSGNSGNFAFAWDVDFVSDGIFLLRGNSLNLESNVGDITAQSVNDINIQATGNVLIDTTTLTGADIVIDSAALLNVDAATGVTIDTAANAIEISTAGSDENSFIRATSNGIGTGALDAQRIESYLKTTGAFHDVELRSDNATAVIAGADILLTSAFDVQIAGDRFKFIATDWAVGITFEDDASLPTEGSLDRTLGTTRGGIYTVADGFSNTKYQSVASETTALVMESGAFRAMGNAPTTKGPGPDQYGESISGANAGKPDINVLYKENVLKAKGAIFVDVSKVGTINSNDGGILDNFNIWGNDASGTVWVAGIGVAELRVRFLTAMPDNSYSVTIGYGETTDIMNFRVKNMNTAGFDIDCYRWNSATPDWELIETTGVDFNLYFQVV